MNKYEVMYILTPDLEEEQVNENIEWAKSIIESNNGKVEELKKWDRRRLAYEIDDYQEGQYMLGYFYGEIQTTSELERSFKLKDQVLRYMIIRVDE
ncbi:30S ribosomal protein S6 [Natranaerofaba carboxydovora]|uniref:30S ribosomal protein S6 n=1 Tax=Natranaerofaba carboxydovora TaxID=2742683 RepID=UPI001F144706|nr:30S ribosomal protein S6 [Natranaerofaba carboxydovora]UMZ75168.1 30S ribosomal protein S6 [Natranaerofaba carboxydovora]